MNRPSLGWYIYDSPCVVRIRVALPVLAERCSADAQNEVSVILALDGLFLVHAGNAVTPTEAELVDGYKRRTGNSEDVPA